MLSSLFERTPDVKEYAKLCFSFAVLQAPYDEQIPPSIHLHSEGDRARIRWNAAHSAQALAVYFAAMIGRRRFKSDHIGIIVSEFLELSKGYFRQPCTALDVCSDPSDVDAAIALLASRGRSIARDDFLKHEQPLGVWYNLLFPIRQQQVRDAIERFATKKAAGMYSEYPGFSGFSDEWATFMVTSLWGGVQEDNICAEHEFVAFGNVAPFVVGPIEGLAKKYFG